MASTLRTYKREILFEKDKPNVMGSYMQPKYQIRHTIIYKVTPLLLLLFRLLSYILIKDRKCKVCLLFFMTFQALITSPYGPMLMHSFIW